MDEDKKTMNFEEKLQAVQDLADKIESGKLSLEDSVRQYEDGMKILGELDQELQNMNRRLTVLRDGKETELNDPDL
jgi:exodeoxyribonuclease VII small subunit